MKTLNAHAIGRPHFAFADAAATLYGALARALTTVRTWHTRAYTRRELRTLSDRMLADIAMTRDEAIKPFWQAFSRRMPCDGAGRAHGR